MVARREREERKGGRGKESSGVDRKVATPRADSYRQEKKKRA